MKTIQETQANLDATVNTLLGQHRGRVEVLTVSEQNPIIKDGVEIKANIVAVVMRGGCQGCAGAKATLKTIITNAIKEFDPSVEYVIDATDHNDKTNAFF